MVRSGPAQPPPLEQDPYPADKARGGEIILDSAVKRGIFISGLVGAVLLAVLLGVLVEGFH